MIVTANAGTSVEGPHLSLLGCSGFFTAKSRHRGEAVTAFHLALVTTTVMVTASGLRLLYFSELLTEVNLAFRLEPRPLTTAMIASEMPAAIRPYSMAVAPDSSLKKRAKSLDI
jgi:hypothetical protein